MSFPIFILILFSLPFQVVSQNTQQQILLHLKNQLGIQSWNSSSSPCLWPEIICSGTTVTGLVLRDKNITQTIPSNICHLHNLTHLDFANNSIPGQFPKALYNCSKLQYLDLSQNYFVGPIPDDIDLIRTLHYLDLSANNFSGDIPVAIGRLPELQTLFLYQNEFNGTFPREIGNLSNLEYLAMAFNDKFVPAPIPPDFGRLRKLKYMWMTDSNLIGEIPKSFANLSSLQHLDLSINSLTGGMPAGLLLLKNLTNLFLYHNNLSGAIPAPIEAVNLVHIDLSMNNLNGSIPEDLGKLQKLKVLNLFLNELWGEIPASIGLIPSLMDFRIFGNRVSGVLPPELGLYSKLEAFEVSDNQLSGELPENLCAGGALLGVVAFSNKLTGQIPKPLGNCTSLHTLQLYNNKFSGEIPSGLWTSFNLSSLMLTDNSFSGQLPSRLGWNLSRLEIANNLFSGQIPAGSSTWESLVVFKASNNLFSEEIPLELTSLSGLSTLLLDGNQLSGELPSHILSWKSLTTLNLSRNKLSGQIPAAIGSLPDLIYMDLSENEFTGEIPPEIGQLRLTFLNLSSNQLSGKIPDELDNLASENSFLNNSNLCDDNPTINLRSCSARLYDSKSSSKKYLAVILVLTITIFLSTVVLTMLVVRDYSRKKQKHELATWKLTPFQMLNFTQVNIVSSLTENNIIGSGGSGKVYRVALDPSGGFVAVKRIWNVKKLDHHLEKEFVSEVQILGTIRHTNIVKLLCCICSEDSKLLVYEYMENQSLDRWLHGKNTTTSVALDWPRRLQIAIGAAQGLCYMHHDCFPPIIHRDIKSSNILLDSEFKAKVADFGLARLLSMQGEPHTMSAVAGSFGYIAPEYAYTTKVNEKIDVYSFGVVLLELVTGREPNSGDEHMSLAEWAWQYYAEGKSIIDTIDEKIKEACYWEQMTTLFKLGLICTSMLPSSRPSMKEVWHILRSCCPPKSYGVETIGNEFDVAPLLDTLNYVSSYKRKKGLEEDNHSHVHIV